MQITSPEALTVNALPTTYLEPKGKRVPLIIANRDSIIDIKKNSVLLSQ